MRLSKNRYVLLITMALCYGGLYGQIPLYNGTLVSDIGVSNNIGKANTSRNVTVDNNGNIYVVYTGSSGIRVAKSMDRGQSFLPSVSVTIFNAEPEIIVNDAGIIFVAWSELGNIMLSRSTDNGETFSAPYIVGAGFFSVHMAVFDDNIYVTDKLGEYLYYNLNNGVGTFSNTQLTRQVFADVRVDQNGVVYMQSDNPNVSLFNSFDEGSTFSRIFLRPSIRVFFSSYTLSDGPCGTFVFTGGFGDIGYKVDVSNGQGVSIPLGNNFTNEGRTLYADHRGTLIDGYQNNLGELVMNISNDQGQTFAAPVVIGQGESHNIARNPVTEDIVVVYEQSGQIYLSVYNDLLKTIKIETLSSLTNCYGDTLTIPYALTGGFDSNTDLTFYISDETGNFENKTLIGTVVTNTNGSINIQLANTILPGNQYRIQIESLADCTQSNIVDLGIYDMPYANISRSSGSICQGEDAVFLLEGTPNAEVLYTLNSVNSNVVALDASGNASVTVFGAVTDQSLSLELVENPLEGCSVPLNDTALVLINPLPRSLLQDTYLLCMNTNGTEMVTTPLVIDTFLSDTDYHFEWFFNSTILPSFSGLPAIFPSQGGEYTVEVTNITTGCYTLSNVAMVNESSPPIINPRVVTPAFARNHVVDVEVTNNASLNAISEYEFSLNNGTWVLGNGNPGGAYNYVFDEDVKLGTNTIRVRDIKGCGENEIEVIVMDYPHFFTPNGDRIHDTWNITGAISPTNYLASANIFIFDRYGKLLKQINPLGPGWDGTFNGRLMPTEDYWFVVNFIDPLDNQSKQFKAHFTLKR